MSQIWEKRIINLIEKYRPLSDAGTFRNDYRDAIADAVDDPKVGAAGSKLLLEARDHLESWASEAPPAPAEAVSQWQTFYASAIGKLPVSVLEALLRRFPVFEEREADLDEFVLACAEQRLIKVLIDRRLVTEQHLNSLARSHPAEFMQSAALDVLASRGALKDGKALWREGVAVKTRPIGLLSKHQVLVTCYAGIPGKKGDELLATLVGDEADAGDRVLDAVLDDREATIRFGMYLVERVIHARRRNDRLRDILTRWLNRAASFLHGQNEEKAVTTSLLLGQTRLSLIGAGEWAGKLKLSELSASIASATEEMILGHLRKHESGSAGATSPVMVLRGDELYAAVQRYLRELPTGARANDESPERALRHERHLGRKEVLEQVLHALHDAEEGSAVRDALEVAMFNSGVRPIGAEGEESTFDARLHDAETPGLLPGDPVVLVRPGQRLGDSDDGLVLVKAKVRAA